MKRREFLAFSALSTVFLHHACTPDTNARVKFTEAAQRTFPVLEVTGSYYDIGFQIGKHFANNIKSVMKKRASWLEELYSVYKTPEGRDYTEKLKEALKDNFPEYLEEIRGMSDGSGIEFNTMWLMSIKSELASFEKEPPGCSTIYYKDEQNNWLFQNEDGHAAYKDDMFVLKAHPPSGVSYISFVYPGIITGVGPGFNDRGICHSSNFIGCTAPKLGIPRYFFGRAILEAKDLKEAKKIVTTEPRAFPWHHNIAYMKSGEYMSIETLPDGTVEARKPDGLYCHTNHTIHPKTKDYEDQDLVYRNSSSLSRYNVIQPKIAALSDKVTDPGVFLAMLSSHESKPYSPCRHPEDGIEGQTLGTVFFDINKGTMRLYKQNPCISVPGGHYFDYKF